MSKFSNFWIAIGRWIKSLFVAVDNNEPKLKVLLKKDSTKSIFAALIAILGGILVGVIIMLIVGLALGNVKDLFRGLLILIGGPFFNGSFSTISFGIEAAAIGRMLFRTVPILMTGLSVALAFKTGLFNIGAPGQFLMGTMGSLIVALSIPTTQASAFWVWLLALFTGIVLGMIWGAIPGLFKAFLNINEVITCIMTNWIAANLVSWIFSVQPNLWNIPEGKTGYLFPTLKNGVSNPSLGMDKLFPGSMADGGIIIAIVLAIVVFVVLNKTTFGFELRATGSNRNAAKYAGMNEKRNIILSMSLAGGLAACGACLYFLNGRTEFFWEASMSLPSEGFNGIPVALLASNNPIGVIFAAMFMAFLNISGSNLSGFTQFNEHIASLIVGVIIYFSGFSMLMRQILSGQRKKKGVLAVSPAPTDNATSAQPIQEHNADPLCIDRGEQVIDSSVGEIAQESSVADNTSAANGKKADQKNKGGLK